MEIFNAEVISWLVNALKDITAAAQKTVSRELLKWKFEEVAGKLYDRTSLVTRVKTILHNEKYAEISDFYCHTKLRIGDGEKAIKALSEIPVKGNILIEGIVGQGKSIFLRYLCYHELYLFSSIPIFIELRQTSADRTINDQILSYFDIVGISADEAILDYLCSEGRITLFLDGFDEVVSSQRNRIIAYLDHLSKKYPNLRIIVSSRPNSGIEKLPHFQVFNIVPLREADIVDLIRKVVRNVEFEKEILFSLENSHHNIKDLLTTPLMVVLLVYTYKSIQKIPEQLTEFYENLFYNLQFRHDRTKPGFTRERKCELNEKEYKEIFEYICFYGKGHSNFSLDGIYAVCKKGIGKIGKNVDPKNYIEDIVQITCLILNDEHRYYFIHQSIQQFHAASFIQKSPEAFAKNFYGLLYSKGMQNWYEELEFLSEIDNYRFEKHFRVPTLRMEIKSIGSEKGDGPGRTNAAYVFTKFNFVLWFNGPFLDRIVFSPKKQDWLALKFRNFFSAKIRTLEKSVLRKDSLARLLGHLGAEWSSESEMERSIELSLLLELPEFKIELGRIASEYDQVLRELLERTLGKISERERLDELDDLLRG